MRPQRSRRLLVRRLEKFYVDDREAEGEVEQRSDDSYLSREGELASRVKHLDYLEEILGL